MIKRLFFLSVMLLLAASPAESTTYYSLAASSNTATLNCRRTGNFTIIRNNAGITAIDYYLYHPATDWGDESDCQNTSSLTFGANQFIDFQMSWENQWELFGFDTSNYNWNFNYELQVWYDWSGQRSNHLTGFGTDFINVPGDPWAEQTTDLPGDPDVNLFAFHAWLRPIENLPAGYLGSLWRTQAYILAKYPAGDCTRCYYFVPAARILGLSAGVIRSNTCTGPELNLQFDGESVPVTFNSAAPHVMAGIWHDALGQWIPFDLGMNSAGFPWLNQVIEGISPDITDNNDVIFIYRTGDSYAKTYSTSVVWGNNVFQPQNYAVLESQTENEVENDANIRIYAQCRAPSFVPTMPPVSGESDTNPPRPTLGLNVWPNPLRPGQPLYVEMTSPLPNDRGTITLYDIQGRSIKEEQVVINGLTNRLWQDQLASGMYFLNLVT